ncbi:MAG: hypothetical protein P8Q97_02625 [Myxococcota bacterium]|jgi:protein O-mannosyl-transferase|nr:hypothetical protein [Myxococcota bacterium]
MTAEAGAGKRFSGGPGMAWLGLIFVGLALGVYAPSFQGQFISDDLHYVAHNEYVHTLSLENWVDIWDPSSEVAELVENYAPVHLTLHSLEWQLFGPEVMGYHVVNVLLHAVAAWLLVLLYRRSGISAWASALGAAFFLLHPANVESVAWISQLKSSSALVLSLGAILLHPKRPALALVLFALALLAKPFAASALVMVGLFGWLQGQRAAEDDDIGFFGPRATWLWGWLAALGIFAIAEVVAFSLSAGLAPPLYPDPVVRGLMIFSVALRYAMIAVSGLGVSTFHEPQAIGSLVDPFLIGGVFLLVGLGARAVVCLAARREEAVYWIWAAVGFAPLSGVVPLPYPMADRYLYFVLPGLIGGVLLAGQQWLPRWEARLGVEKKDREIRQALLAVGLAFCALFVFASHDRASVFYSAETLMTDAEKNYPDGAAASTRKASRAARRGDKPAALAALRFARSRGYNRVDHLLQDPAYASLQDDPDFVAIKNEMAQDWITRLGDLPAPGHYKARALAQAYVAVYNFEAAVAVLEAAANRPGPIPEALRGDARDVAAEMRFRARLEASRMKSEPALP